MKKFQATSPKSLSTDVLSFLSLVTCQSARFNECLLIAIIRIPLEWSRDRHCACTGCSTSSGYRGHCIGECFIILQIIRPRIGLQFIGSILKNVRHVYCSFLSFIRVCLACAWRTRSCSNFICLERLNVIFPCRDSRSCRICWSRGNRKGRSSTRQWDFPMVFLCECGIRRGFQLLIFKRRYWLCKTKACWRASCIII